MGKIIEFVDRDARWGDLEILAFAVTEIESAPTCALAQLASDLEWRHTAY
jgi:hypothetical protein